MLRINDLQNQMLIHNKMIHMHIRQSSQFLVLPEHLENIVLDTNLSSNLASKETRITVGSNLQGQFHVRQSLEKAVYPRLDRRGPCLLPHTLLFQPPRLRVPIRHHQRTWGQQALFETSRL